MRKQKEEFFTRGQHPPEDDGASPAHRSTIDFTESVPEPISPVADTYPRTQRPPPERADGGPQPLRAGSWPQLSAQMEDRPGRVAFEAKPTFSRITKRESELPAPRFGRTFRTRAVANGPLFSLNLGRRRPEHSAAGTRCQPRTARRASPPLTRCHTHITNPVDALTPQGPDLDLSDCPGPAGPLWAVSTACARWDGHGPGRTAVSLSVAGRSAFEGMATHRAEILEPRSTLGCRLSARYSHSACLRKRQVSSPAVRHGGPPWGESGEDQRCWGASGENRLHKTARP